MNTLAPEFKEAHPINLSTDKALENTVLSPRFYTTDFKELDGMNIESMRGEWDKLMKEFAADPNQSHFQRPDNMLKNYSQLPEAVSYTHLTLPTNREV